MSSCINVTSSSLEMSVPELRQSFLEAFQIAIAEKY